MACLLQEMAAALSRPPVMANKISPAALPARAEWLMALGYVEEAFALIGRIPPRDRQDARFRALQLKLLTSGGHWQEGLYFAGQISRRDEEELRKAAGRFLVAYALSQLARGNSTTAAKLTTQAGAVWPEGKIDALTLGLEHRPPPSMEGVEPIFQLPREQAATGYLRAKGGHLWQGRFRTRLLRLRAAGPPKPSTPAVFIPRLHAIGVLVMPCLRVMWEKTREHLTSLTTHPIPWVRCR